jgi:exosortase/archaeosortase family protein
VSLLMLAVVLGYFTERRAVPRAAIAIAAIPIAVIANAIRVGGTGLASYWISPAAADGFFHTFSGWLMFMVALAGLVAVHRGLDLARGGAMPSRGRNGDPRFICRDHHRLCGHLRQRRELARTRCRRVRR